MHIFLTIPQGQCIRDFLFLGIVQHILDLLPNSAIVLLTPAHKVPRFAALCPHDRIHIRRMETPIRLPYPRITRYRKKAPDRLLQRSLLKLEVARFTPPAYILDSFREFSPPLLVSTHPMPSHDYLPVMTARKLGVPTIGIVKSWDNVGKGFSSYTDQISVWNPVNHDEAISLQGYTPDEITINGAPSFDPYFDESWFLERHEFIESLKLDPSRPLITYATSGVYNLSYYGRDETFLADDLLRIFASVPELQDAQLVIRLHPVSRLEDFWSYRDRPDIRFSFASYMPTIGWYTDHNDIKHQTNLLKHSDVIVTPASSWVLEAAIFDTPTVVPVYSDIQPDHAKAQFDEFTLVRHFQPLINNNWIPICRSYDQLRNEMIEAITKPEKHAQARKEMVDNYIYHRDGKSARRVAEWIARIAQSVAE